jgi:hypothetical protein
LLSRLALGGFGVRNPGQQRNPFEDQEAASEKEAGDEPRAERRERGINRTDPSVVKYSRQENSSVAVWRWSNYSLHE